jgi:cell fate regulator YaaT (PSP1 superfamily)
MPPDINPGSPEKNEPAQNPAPAADQPAGQAAPQNVTPSKPAGVEPVSPSGRPVDNGAAQVMEPAGAGQIPPQQEEPQSAPPPKPEPAQPEKPDTRPEFTVIARYGMLRYLGLFTTRIPDVRRADRVVLRSDRGTEIGEVLSESKPIQDGERESAIGTIYRRATSDDFRLKREIEEVKTNTEAAFCKAKIKELALPMNLAAVEHLFGGDKIIFYFLADGRVDFRQLVRELAREFRTRIEMKQIGVRDEAKIVSDYEHCGRELCCRAFMRELQPVTMKMAKNQKATLDPSKISGACGRLMCCLRFEDEVYTDLKRTMPRKGAKVLYAGKNAEVIDCDIIQQKIRILVEERNVETVPAKEVQVISCEPREPEPPESEAGDLRDESPAPGNSGPDSPKSEEPPNPEENKA